MSTIIVEPEVGKINQVMTQDIERLAMILADMTQNGKKLFGNFFTYQPEKSCLFVETAHSESPYGILLYA